MIPKRIEMPVQVEEILGKLAYLAGFNPSAEPRSGESLLEDFAWERVPRADIRIPEGLF